MDRADADAVGQMPTNLRLLRIVEEVAQAEDPLTPSAIAAALGLPRATVHRLLTTGEREGFLLRDTAGRAYGAGPRLRRLAMAALSGRSLRADRLAVLEALADEVGETCNLAVPGDSGMVYLDRVETRWPLRIALPVGSEVPFHCTAAGKLYLASLRKDKFDRLLPRLTLSSHTPRSLTDPDRLRAAIARIRAEGHATDDGEFMEEMVAIAVPVTGGDGRFLATLSIHAPLQRYDLAGLAACLPRIAEASARLGALAAG